MSAIIMKAFSLWQPWASLWLTERKIHETRYYKTNHRGWLVVHAAKRFERDFEGGAMEDILDAEFGHHWGQDLPTGAIIGAVDVTDCLSMQVAKPMHDDDWETGNWSPERYAWRRGRVVTLPTPIPYRGQQGLFNVPADAIAPLLDLIPAEQP